MREQDGRPGSPLLPCWCWYDATQIDSDCACSRETNINDCQGRAPFCKWDTDTCVYADGFQKFKCKAEQGGCFPGEFPVCGSGKDSQGNTVWSPRCG